MASHLQRPQLALAAQHCPANLGLAEGPEQVAQLLCLIPWIHMVPARQGHQAQVCGIRHIPHNMHNARALVEPQGRRQYAVCLSLLLAKNQPHMPSLQEGAYQLHSESV